MRTAAWETAPPIALRHCSREAAGKDSIYVILVMGAYMQSNIFFQKVSASQVKLSASHETVVTMRNLSAFLDMRR